LRHPGTIAVVPGTPQAGGRLGPFATTIFAEMTALAVETGSINLGQGFPDTDGPAEVAEAAIAAIRAGANQYPPGPGVPVLREAVAAHQRACYGLEYDPDGEILVTTGATEGIAAALIGLCEPGDEVVMFEPYYDSYAASAAMAGATARMVTLHQPDWSWDPAQLKAVLSDRTRLVLLNSPHNPTGKVFSAEELAAIAAACVERDLIVVTDEVYEHLVFDGRHVPIAGLEGMRDRTVSISSAGKTFSFTGWKIGWACGPSPLVARVRAAKQFLTFATGTPFQHAVAHGLSAGERLVAPMRQSLRAQRDLLCDGLSALGLTVYRPAATYFATTDVASIGEDDAYAFCRSLPTRCGVVAVPSSVFYRDPGPARTLVRWAFCKRPEVLQDALRRLEGLRRTVGGPPVASPTLAGPAPEAR
jgi:N-succinyldiaminopimelate aminotransferase